MDGLPWIDGSINQSTNDCTGARPPLFVPEFKVEFLLWLDYYKNGTHWGLPLITYAPRGTGGGGKPPIHSNLYHCITCSMHQTAHDIYEQWQNIRCS